MINAFHLGNRVRHDRRNLRRDLLAATGNVIPSVAVATGVQGAGEH